MTLDDLWGHTSFYEKIGFYDVDILEKFLKDSALKKKYIANNMILTFCDLWGHT